MGVVVQTVRPLVDYLGGQSPTAGVSNEFQTIINKQNVIKQNAIQSRLDTIMKQRQAAADAAAAQRYSQQRTAQSNAISSRGYVGPGQVGTDNGQGIHYTPGETAGGNIGIWGDPRSPGWQSHNLVTFRSGRISVTVNRQAATAFRGFLNALTRGGYHLNSVQGYNLRNKRMGNGLSEHAFGTAIDINPGQNPNSGSSRLVTNMPTWVGALAARYGLIWGGTWNKSKDAMHFEYVAPSRRGRL